MPAGPGGHGGSERRGVPPSGRPGGGAQQGPRRRRPRSPLETLRGTGRVIPFRRPRQPGAAQELAPRQSRLMVAALAAVLAAVLVFSTVVLRPRVSPPGSDIVLAASQFRMEQPQRIAFADYPHVLPALGTAMYVVRLPSGWEAFADWSPDQAGGAAGARCTLVWSPSATRFKDPCTGAAWLIGGTPAASAANAGRQPVADLSAFPVAAHGAFIDVSVGRLTTP